MKVRHKHYPDDWGRWTALHWTVLRESPGYYICEPRVPGEEFILPKDDYEPVTDVRWVNVTGECIWREGQHLFHGESQLGKIFGEHSDNYRGRTISLWEELPQPMRDTLVAQNTTRPELVGQLMRSTSFLIERKAVC